MTTTEATILPISGLLTKLVETRPDTVARRQHEEAYFKNTVNPFTSFFPDPDKQFVDVQFALKVERLVVIEVSKYRQAPKGGDNAVDDEQLETLDPNDPRLYLALEASIAAPGAKIGQILDGVFHPFHELYGDEDLNYWHSQNPMFFTQHMQAKPSEVDRFWNRLLERGYTEQELRATNPDYTPSLRRRDVQRIAIPTPEGVRKGENDGADYIAELLYRLQPGRSVELSKLTLLSADRQREIDDVSLVGTQYYDPFSALYQTLQDWFLARGTKEEDRGNSPDPAVRKAFIEGAKLLSAITGSHYDADAQRKFANRGGGQRFLIDGDEPEAEINLMWPQAERDAFMAAATAGAETAFVKPDMGNLT